MTNVHPSAIVSSKAQIGNNVTISPLAIIQDDVQIGDDCFIGPNAVIYDGARLGKNIKVYQSASVAHVPQDLKFKNEPSLCFIGDNTTIHEFTTIHRGTIETGFTRIGNNVLLMAYTHVAHDCIIGNNCILANVVQLGGHTHIEDWVIIGGASVVHQFSKVGRHCMIGGGYRVVQDVPPYVLVAGEPLKYEGLNVIGLRRRGFKTEQVETIKKIYSYIYSKNYNISQAKEKIREEFGENEFAVEIIGFIEKCKRGLSGK
ncbi:MAG: acyl-[acyl-carrier-protein]--UDP-N-acetylglucosamine O-acyltransferase [Chlorobiaceae bacterium]|nr:acyl-[acyl-carrier-protein]--UDP-N-acetylglucosamine O-acyltransferase [Chlorobiaceae bacterium]MBA4309865.1 acyl-[acyl-carrier-protein]--UDP-N-acetylglucosamine O-acyltransferase [Chlorobiaceae bacterium]